MKGTRHTLGRRKKMQKIRRRLTVIAAAVILTAILASAFRAITVQADTGEEPKRYKYFTSVFVERDDTLWDLAVEYRTDEYANVQEYMNEVMTINHLADDQLQYGDWITVPYYSSELK